MSTIKVNTLTTLNGSGNITVSRPLAGSGASLTALNATELTSGTIPIARIADDAITLAKMADDAIGVAQLSATGTASNSVFLRGDNSWAAAGSTSASDLTSGTLPMARLSGTLPALNGSALTNLPSSGVKQIVHAGLTTTPALSSSTLTATGLTANITPSATTSKIQIHVHLPVSAQPDAGHTTFVQFRLYRGSTAIGTVGTGASGNQVNVQWHTAHSSFINTANYEEYAMQNFTGFFVDSPSSTSAIAYSVKWAIAASSSGDAQLNRVWANDNGVYLFNGASTIMLTEVDNG